MKGVQNIFVKSREKEESINLAGGVAASDRHMVGSQKKVVLSAPSPILLHPVTKLQL